MPNKMLLSKGKFIHTDKLQDKQQWDILYCTWKSNILNEKWVEEKNLLKGLFLALCFVQERNVHNIPSVCKIQGSVY